MEVAECKIDGREARVEGDLRTIFQTLKSLAESEQAIEVNQNGNWLPLKIEKPKKVRRTYVQKRKRP
jgi:hypothetical protein